MLHHEGGTSSVLIPVTNKVSGGCISDCLAGVSCQGAPSQDTSGLTMAVVPLRCLWLLNSKVGHRIPAPAVQFVSCMLRELTSDCMLNELGRVKSQCSSPMS